MGLVVRKISQANWQQSQENKPPGTIPMGFTAS